MNRILLICKLSLVLVSLCLATVVIGLLAKDVEDLPAWVQAVFSVVAIGAAIVIMHMQHNEARDAALQAQKDRTRYVLTAIQSELDVFPGPLVEMTSHRLNTWPTIEITFPVYEACAGEIGSVDDQYLRHRVISAYASIRSVLAAINLYGVLAQQFGGQDAITQLLRNREEGMWTELNQTGRDTYNELKEVDALLKVAIDKLLQPR